MNSAASQIQQDILTLPAANDRRQDKLLIVLFCIAAAVRIFLFSAAFPFFDNSDEATHFDTIVRYASGEIPKELSMYSPQGAAMVARYNSPEYFDLPSVNVMPPSGSVTPAEAQAAMKRLTLAWTRRVSHESTGPPLYYAVAGAWYDMGKILGLQGARLLYWTRYLNIPIFVLLIIAAYLLTRRLFPAARLLWLGVPFLLAFLPQDIFYSLNNDPMAALLGTMALYCIVVLDQAENPSTLLLVATGLAAAGAFLTKYTTAPVLAMLLLIAWRKQRPRFSFRQPIARAAWLPLLCTAVPIFIWFARNYALWGDPTGMAARNRFLGWSHKPISQWWNHPVFTPHGLAAFAAELTRTFWRGEFCWHRVTLAMPIADEIYVATTAVFIGCFLVWYFIPKREQSSFFKNSGSSFCLTTVALSLALLIYLSISNDFGNCPYPSQEWPYFSSGRLILAAVVPILILYLSGLEIVLGWLRLGFLLPYILAGLVLLMTISEIVLSRGVFASQYNWFHLH